MLYPSVGFIPLFGDKVVEDRRIRHLAKKSALFVCPYFPDPRTSQPLIHEQTNSKKMKKLFVLLFCAVSFASCGVFVPRSVNTINRAPLADLNLDREDYEILNTITAEATVNFKRNWNGHKIQLSESGGEFAVNYKLIPFKFKKTSMWVCKKMQGIIKVGSLVDEQVEMSLSDPQELAERLALYRAINIAKEYGADAIVEPSYTVSAEAINRRQVVYKATVSAKIIKLKTNR